MIEVKRLAKNTRDSNIELMRLVCMFMIVVHHLIIHNIYDDGIILCGTGGGDSNIITATVIDGVCYIGVNCFMLITGFYGVNFRWKSVYKICLWLLFYSFYHLLSDKYLFQTASDLATSEIIKQSFHVFTGYAKGWWFMQSYIIFLFIAPLIRFDGVTKIYHQKLILLVTVANVGLGYWCHNYGSGYTVAQFVFMYVIGQYIKKYITISKSLRYKALFCYIMFSIIYIGMNIIRHNVFMAHWEGVPYNNPILVCSAISFFLFMKSFSFYNRTINYIAGSALAIYLLQDVTMRCTQPMMDYLGAREFFNANPLKLVCSLTIVATLFSISALLIDQVRKIISKPFLALFDFFDVRTHRIRNNFINSITFKL